jgi:hypothetical protein
MEKQQIKNKVIEKLDVFYKNNLEIFERQTEGSLTDNYKYMSLRKLNIALEMCFEETFNQCNPE